jgi:hypothetical protein
MSEMIDLEKLYREERKRWMREEAPRRSFRDMLTGSVPYWIVLVALVLYGLSAPHTAGVFDKLTPAEVLSPRWVFELLYAAFRPRLAKSENEALLWTLWVLEILLFLTAMLVNGAGAFSSVVAAVDLESLFFFYGRTVWHAACHIPGAGDGAAVRSERTNRTQRTASERTDSHHKRPRPCLSGCQPQPGQLSVNRMLATLNDAGVQAGRTTVADVLQERKPISETNSG